MDEILHIELTGKFNGRDARVSIGLDAETAFEIEDMSTSGTIDDVDEKTKPEQETPTQAEADTAQTQETQTGQAEPTEEPEGTEEPEEPEGDEEPEEPTGLDQLFPQNGYDEEELPTMNPGTKKHKVAIQVLENNGQRIKVSDLRRQLEEEYPDENWTDSNVSASTYNFIEDGILDREKNENGVWEYEITDLGRATLEHAETQDSEE